MKIFPLRAPALSQTRPQVHWEVTSPTSRHGNVDQDVYYSKLTFKPIFHKIKPNSVHLTIKSMFCGDNMFFKKLLVSL